MAPASWSRHKARFQLNSWIPLHSNSSTWATCVNRTCGRPHHAASSFAPLPGGGRGRGEESERDSPPLTPLPHTERERTVWTRRPPEFLASGATASSKGAQPVCRLPLAAFHPWTSDFSSRRPAAVIQYEPNIGGYGGNHSLDKPFIGAGGHRIHINTTNHTRWFFLGSPVSESETDRDRVEENIGRKAIGMPKAYHLAERRTVPRHTEMPIDSPHGLCIRRKR